MHQIPIFRPSVSHLEEEYVKAALNSKSVDLIERFEEKLKDYFGVKYAITTNNGTAAKHLLLCAMDLKRGDRVVCSVNSEIGVPTVIRHFDAEPIFCDIDRRDYNIDPNKLDETLKTHSHKKLKAVFLNHIGGQVSDIEAIQEVANAHGVVVFDDAISVVGAKHKGKFVGTHNLAGCIQINPQLNNSPASTGVILTNDEKIATRAKLIRSHAIVNEGLKLSGNLDYVYDVVEAGCKYDLNTLPAAFNLAQFERLESFITRRKAIAARYFESLQNLPNIKLIEPIREHIYTAFIIEISKNRDIFAKKLKALGVSTMLNYIPMHLLTYYKNKYHYKVNDFPVVLSAYQHYLSLPIFEDMSDAEVKQVIDAVKKVAND